MLTEYLLHTWSLAKYLASITSFDLPVLSFAPFTEGGASCREGNVLYLDCVVCDMHVYVRPESSSSGESNTLNLCVYCV